MVAKRIVFAGRATDRERHRPKSPLRNLAAIRTDGRECSQRDRRPSARVVRCLSEVVGRRRPRN